jgi:hypothetical protein
MVWHWTTAFCDFLFSSAPVYTSVPGSRPGIMSLPKPSDTIRPRAGPTRLRISFKWSLYWTLGASFGLKMGRGSRLLGLYYHLHCTCIGFFCRAIIPRHGTALRSYSATAIPRLKDSRRSPRYLMIKADCSKQDSYHGDCDYGR